MSKKIDKIIFDLFHMENKNIDCVNLNIYGLEDKKIIYEKVQRLLWIIEHELRQHEEIHQEKLDNENREEDLI